MARDTTPKVTFFNDDQGAVVIRTHDVELAREVILDALSADAFDDDEALEVFEDYLAAEPVAQFGRWTFWGRKSVDEGARVWNPCPEGSRGASRALVWSL